MDILTSALIGAVTAITLVVMDPPKEDNQVTPPPPPITDQGSMNAQYWLTKERMNPNP